MYGFFAKFSLHSLYFNIENLSLQRVLSSLQVRTELLEWEYIFVIKWEVVFPNKITSML